MANESNNTEKKSAMELKVEELRDKLETQLEQFLTIWKNFPEILYITDPDTYEVVFVNDVFKNLLGTDPTGKICYEQFQGLDKPCEFCTNDIILKQSEPYAWEFYNPIVDKHFYIKDQIVKWPDGRKLRFEVATDITERKKAQEELKAHKEQLEEVVARRTAQLEKLNEELKKEVEERQERELVIEQQSREMLELSTPVVQVWKGIIALPLIGTLDSSRTSQFMEKLLNSIANTGSPIAIIDITGVPTIDTQTAQHLIEAVSAAKLLGAKVILTGIRPVIAQTIIHLGVDLSGIITQSTLSEGLKIALNLLDLEIKAKSGGSKDE